MSGEKKAYVITNGDVELSKIIALTDDQYKAINWFIETFDGADVSDIFISVLSDEIAEEIE